MDGAVSVDVCVATFRRPELLTATLQSLALLNVDGVQLRVVVVDNDKNMTASDAVKAFRQSAPFEVVYDVEPVQNIALARNRALTHVSAFYFAFLDDDEIVPSDWLSNLLATMEQYDADAVFGPVDGLLPLDAPPWARVQPAFSRKRFPTGTCLEHGATNNVLVRRSALYPSGHLFDPAYGLTGGEDADFFYRLHLKGKRLVWCNEAVVTEYVPASRLTVRWVRQRGFRTGQSYMRVFVSRYPFRKKIFWFMLKILHLVGGVFAVPVLRFLSYPKYVRLTVRLMASIGQLSVLFNGKIYEEYRSDRIVS